jgi:hypothetical protein
LSLIHGLENQTGAADFIRLQQEYSPIYSDLKVNPEAAALLMSLNNRCRNLAIITVVGKYRTGKSYILNRVLLQQNSGFEVGPTINACTKGLWIWPVPVEISGGD